MKKRTVQIMIFLLVLDVVGGAGLWFGYVFIQDKRNEELALQEKITAESQKGYKNITLARTLATVKDDRTELLRFLSDASEEGQIQFVSQIEQLGTTTTGALVETQSLVFTKDDPPALRADFSIKGSWNNMYYFLRFLEEFPSRLVINRFDANYSSGDKIWAGGVQLDLNSLKMNK